MAKTKIVLIGITEYNSIEIPNLSSAFDNVAALNKIFKYDENDIDVHHIVDCNTKSILLLSLRRIAQEKAYENLIIYYSGHGILDDNETLYLTVKDSTSDNIDINGISISDLSSSLGDCSVIFIFDCCFSERAFVSISQSSFAAIASSAKNIPSKYPLGEENSTFTSELIDILSFGINSSEKELSLKAIFDELEARLNLKEMPTPKISSQNKIENIILSKNYFGERSRQSITFDPQDCKVEILEEFNQSLVSYCLKDSISPKTLDEIFVPMPLFYESEEKFYNSIKATTKARRKETSIQSIIEDDNNYILHGKQETGKTTLLYHCISQVLASPGIYSHNIPCYIKFLNLNTNNLKGSFEKEIKIFFGQISLNQLNSILEEGQFLVFIDDVDFDDEGRIKIIKNFIKKHSNFKYIIAANQKFNEALEFEHKNFNLGLKFEEVFLHSFRKKETDILVDKWYYGSDVTSIEKKSLKLQLFNTLVLTQIPRNPINICFLLWIFETSNKAKGINNRASLIEEFVEIVLEKFPMLQGKINNSFEKVDYRTKQHYLAHLVGEMVVSNKFTYSFQELVDNTTSFFNEIGNKKVDIRRFIEYLLDKGILSERENQYMFKFKCVGEYFIARQMIESKPFYNFILEPNRYLNYSTEIDYLTGLQRNNEELLQSLQKRVEEGIKEHEELSNIKLEYFNKIEVKGDFFENENILIDSISMDTDASAVTDSNTDSDINDSLELISPSNNQELQKNDKHNVEGLKCIEALRLFSIVLKNCEFVPIQTKTLMMDFAMKSWSELTIYIMAMTEETIRNQDFNDLTETLKIKTGKKIVKKELTKREKEEIESAVKIMLPLIMQTLIRDSIGSDKIEGILLEQLHENKPFITRLLATFLYVDLSFSKYPFYLRKLYNESPQTEYISKLLYAKAISKFVMSSDLSDREKRNLGAFAVDIYVKDIIKERSKGKQKILKDQFLKKIDLERTIGKNLQNF